MECRGASNRNYCMRQQPSSSSTTPVSHVHSCNEVYQYVNLFPFTSRRRQATITPRANSVNLPSDVKGGTRRETARSLTHSPTSKKSWNAKKVPTGKATMATVNSTSVLTTERLCFANNLRRPGHRVKPHGVGKGSSHSVYDSAQLGRNGY